MCLGGARQHAMGRVDDLHASKRRVHGVHGGIAGIEPEQGAKEWERRREILVEPTDALLELGDHGGGAVVVLDTAGLPEHVDHGVKRSCAAKRYCLGLDPCRRLAQALPELLQEPRLPDAGLAHDHEHLSRTRASPLEALDEELQLTLPSDEARAAGRALREADQA